MFVTGDIVFMHDAGWLSRAIRWCTRSKGERPTWANHTAIAYDNNLVVDTRVVVSMKVSKYFSPSKYVILRDPVMNGYPSFQNRMKTVLGEYVGKKYGWVKLIAHGFDVFFGGYYFRKLARMDKYPVCSWVVAESYKKVLERKNIFGVPSWVASPDDIMDFCIQNKWMYVGGSNGAYNEVYKLYGGLLHATKRQKKV